MLQRLRVAMLLVAMPKLGLSFQSLVQESVRANFNFHEVRQTCMNFLPTELVWILQNKAGVSANVEYSQGVWAQVPTQATCKHDNLVGHQRLDSAGGQDVCICLDKQLYAYKLGTQAPIVVNEGWIQFPVHRHLTTFTLIYSTYIYCRSTSSVRMC